MTVEIISLSMGPGKAVVAGPAGRRAPDHFFGRVCFPPYPFFLVLAHFSLRLPLIFNLLMQSSITLVARVIHRPTYSLVHEKWQSFTVRKEKFIIQNRS